MLLMLLIGWAVVLPILVVAGLLVASGVLGARARATGTLDVTGMATEIAAFVEIEPASTSSERSPSPSSERHPVGAGI